MQKSLAKGDTRVIVKGITLSASSGEVMDKMTEQNEHVLAAMMEEREVMKETKGLWEELDRETKKIEEENAFHEKQQELSKKEDALDKKRDALNAKYEALRENALKTVRSRKGVRHADGDYGDVKVKKQKTG